VPPPTDEKRGFMPGSGGEGESWRRRGRRELEEEGEERGEEKRFIQG